MIKFFRNKQPTLTEIKAKNLQVGSDLIYNNMKVKVLDVVPYQNQVQVTFETYQGKTTVYQFTVNFYSEQLIVVPRR